MTIDKLFSKYFIYYQTNVVDAELFIDKYIFIYAKISMELS